MVDSVDAKALRKYNRDCVALKACVRDEAQLPLIEREAAMRHTNGAIYFVAFCETNQVDVQKGSEFMV